MTEIIQAGDRHVRKDPDFWRGCVRYFDWLVEQPFNRPENIYIDSGDLFHRAYPSPDEYELVGKWLKRCKFSKLFLFTGNHDFPTTGVSTSIQPLYLLDPRVNIVKTPELVDVGGYKVLFLPFEYHTVINGVKVPRQDYYNRLLELNPGFKGADLLIHHFPDETQSFGTGKKKTGINLEAYEAKRRSGGDIHLQSDHYLGVPVPTRTDEAGQQGRLLRVNVETRETEYITVPRFIDFVTVKFGEEPKANPEGDTLLIVVDAPSRQAAIDRYASSWRVYSVRTTVHLSAAHAEEEEKPEGYLTVEEHFEKFVTDRKVSEGVASLVREALVQPSLSGDN